MLPFYNYSSSSTSFLIGALTATAVRHARAHFRPVPVEVKKTHPNVQDAHLPAAVKEQLLQAAQVKFQVVLDHSADELQRDLTDHFGSDKQAPRKARRRDCHQ